MRFKVFCLFLLAYRYPIAVAPFIEKTILFNTTAFTILSKISWPYLCGYFFSLSFCPQTPNNFISITIQKIFKSGAVITPILFLFVKIVLGVYYI